jgi:hypothetical protein
MVGASTLGLDEHCRKTRIHQDTPSTIAASRRPQSLHAICLVANDALRSRTTPALLQARHVPGISPLHDVKKSASPLARGNYCFLQWMHFPAAQHGNLAGARRTRKWWSQTGSNRRPEACKATALPAELWPLNRGLPREGVVPWILLRPPKMVGLGRFELPTSRLSSARSNQLSYKPDAGADAIEHPKHRATTRLLCGQPKRRSMVRMLCGHPKHHSKSVHPCEGRETKTAVSRSVFERARGFRLLP